MGGRSGQHLRGEGGPDLSSSAGRLRSQIGAAGDAKHLIVEDESMTTEDDLKEEKK